MKVLLTGGYGNLGAWLAKKLINSGHDVTILSRSKKSFLNHLPHQFIECNITQKDQFDQVSKTAWDAVIHAASQNDFFIEDYANKALSINTLGTRNLCEALAENPPKHFLYFSTFHVYGAAHGQIDESSPTLPRNDYASTHLFAEHYVRQFHLTKGLNFDIIRLTNSYGCPTDPATSKWYLVLNDLAKMAFEKKEIVLNSNGKAQRDFIWMGEVAEVVEGMISREMASNTVYNLGSEITYQVLEIAAAVQTAYYTKFGAELPIQVNEKDTNPHDKILQVNSAKLKAILPWTSTNHFENEATKIFQLLENQAG